jgi:hypothetical protein
VLKAQISHLENILERDLENALSAEKTDGQPPVINPTEGKELLCPELLAKIKDPSEEQISLLEKMYSNIACRKQETTSPESAEDEKITFLLSSMSVLEEAKKAREVEKINAIGQDLSQTQEKYPEDIEDNEEEPEDTRQNLEGKLKRLKSKQEIVTKAILKTMEAAGHQVLASGGTSLLKRGWAAYQEEIPEIQKYLQKLQAAEGALDQVL